MAISLAAAGRSASACLTPANQVRASLHRQARVEIQELAPRHQRVGHQLGGVGGGEQAVRPRAAGERQRHVGLPQAGDVDLPLPEQDAGVGEVVHREAGVLARLRHLLGVSRELVIMNSNTV